MPSGQSEHGKVMDCQSGPPGDHGKKEPPFIRIVVSEYVHDQKEGPYGQVDAKMPVEAFFLLYSLPGHLVYLIFHVLKLQQCKIRCQFKL
jgi:hypothetical protein